MLTWTRESNAKNSSLEHAKGCCVLGELHWAWGLPDCASVSPTMVQSTNSTLQAWGPERSLHLVKWLEPVEVGGKGYLLPWISCPELMSIRPWQSSLLGRAVSQVWGTLLPVLCCPQNKDQTQTYF